MLQSSGLLLIVRHTEFNRQTGCHSVDSLLNHVFVRVFPVIVDFRAVVKLWNIPREGVLSTTIQIIDPAGELTGVTSAFPMQNVRPATVPGGVDKVIPLSPFFYRAGTHVFRLVVENNTVSEYPVTLIKEAADPDVFGQVYELRPLRVD